VQDKPLLSGLAWRAAAAVALLLLVMAIIYVCATLIGALSNGIHV
jgi:hypothetical protein